MVKRSHKDLTQKQIKHFVQAACDASFEGAKASLKWFERIPPVEKKADRSPVTRADRETEIRIRKILRSYFPDHLIFGEEFGEEGPKESPFKWWIDPIDGTLQFIRGIPFWGSVVGLEYRGNVVAGCLHLPAIQLQIYAGRGLGTKLNGSACRVSKVSKLKDATISSVGVLRASATQEKKIARLAREAYDQRGAFDVFSHACVISGKMDAALDLGIRPYDVSAVKICVEEAGGKYTSWDGENSIYAAAGVSSNGLIHRQCVKILSN
jgi:histidinol-phosphatase